MHLVRLSVCPPGLSRTGLWLENKKALCEPKLIRTYFGTKLIKLIVFSAQDVKSQADGRLLCRLWIFGFCLQFTVTDYTKATNLCSEHNGDLNNSFLKFYFCNFYAHTFPHFVVTSS